jgi:predicted subunit of tRNA(5-methylaminomethyl-2-thiouridylate) methyltransferase
MPQAAEVATFDATAPAAPPRPMRALPVEAVRETSVRDDVVRRLAADRLRDLRDDGITLAYIARMYGVDVDEIRSLASDLVPSMRR